MEKATTTGFTFWQTIVQITILFLFSSCAQVVAPGGGPKDETPPQTLSYLPDSASTHFKAKSIIISFDEYIQLNDLQNQLIVSPPLKKQPDIKIKEKDLLITFDEVDTLKANTTYVINFGTAIKDVNEGNTKDGFRYIFSTGHYIDSLTVSGKVWNAFNHTTEKGILVMLYNGADDSAIYNQTPDYFTKTNEDGSFMITNVREGYYQLRALKDNNANYKYEEGEEKVAFSDTLIRAGSSNNLLLELFEEPKSKCYLQKFIYNTYGRITLFFNQGSDSIAVTPISHTFASEDIFQDASKNKDTLTYWFRNIEKDSLYLQVSNGYKILDTIELKLLSKEEALQDKKNPLQFKMMSSPDGNMRFDLGSALKITVSTPLTESKSIKSDLLLKEDSVKWSSIGKELKFKHQDSHTLILSVTETSKEKTEDPNNKGVFIRSGLSRRFTDWKPNTNYHLFIPPGAITDFFGLNNDSINIYFRTQEEDFYGSLKLNVNVPELKKGQYLLQLMDEAENVIRENYLTKNEIINYSYLLPQKYKLKLIDDRNMNSEWDSGELLQKLPPEKIKYYPDLINIRSNWDLEMTWEAK